MGGSSFGETRPSNFAVGGRTAGLVTDDDIYRTTAESSGKEGTREDWPRIEGGCNKVKSRRKNERRSGEAQRCVGGRHVFLEVKEGGEGELPIARIWSMVCKYANARVRHRACIEGHARAWAPSARRRHGAAIALTRSRSPQGARARRRCCCWRAFARAGLRCGLRGWQGCCASRVPRVPCTAPDVGREPGRVGECAGCERSEASGCWKLGV